MSYSQGDEEQVILDLLGDQPPGHVLDVGAYDGVTFSNTHALFQRGWGGILVEPEPAAFLSLLDLYRNREDITLVNAGVGIGWHLTRFWRTADLVSTTVESHFQKWRAAANFTGLHYVPVLPISTLFIAPAFDLVSIDTEGTSAILGLAALGLPQRLQPSCYVIEHDNRQRELAEAAAVHGFSVRLTNAENVILGR